MKCSYCQNQLDNDAQFCPNCGTILGAEIEDNYEDLDAINIEDISNVFKAPVDTHKKVEAKSNKKPLFAKKPKPEPVVEVPVVDEIEVTQVLAVEETPVVETCVVEEPPVVEIPVVEEPPVVETPAVEETPVEETPVVIPAVAAKAKKGKKARKNKKAAEKLTESTDKKIDKYEEAFAPEEAFSNSHDVKEEPVKPQEPTDIYSYTSPEAKEEVATTQVLSDTNDEPSQEITQVLVDETPVEEAPAVEEETYNIFQPVIPDEDEYAVEEETDFSAQDSDDKMDKDKKKKLILSPIIIAALAVVIMLVLNFDSVKELVDKIGVETTTEEVTENNIQDADSSLDDEEEDSTDDYILVTDPDDVETDEDETDDTDDVEDEDLDIYITDDDTLVTQITSTTTTQAATTTTTQAATTTTQAATTTTTQAATTTQSATTTTSSSSSTTTDPYGINDVTIQTPTSYLSSSYTSYVLYSGLMITNKPSSSGERVIYVELGADLTVLAEENGYSYVRSNRIGVYGWILSSNISTSRPVESTTATTSGVESPDTIYDTYITMYISPSDGLNLRYGPSTSYDIIKNIQQNYEVQVVGYSDGDTSWVYIIDSTYGITGWVSAEYLSATPVR